MNEIRKDFRVREKTFNTIVSKMTEKEKENLVFYPNERRRKRRRIVYCQGCEMYTFHMFSERVETEPVITVNVIINCSICGYESIEKDSRITWKI